MISFVQLDVNFPRKCLNKVLVTVYSIVAVFPTSHTNSTNLARCMVVKQCSVHLLTQSIFPPTNCCNLKCMQLIIKLYI